MPPRGSATSAERRERRSAVDQPEIVMEAAAGFLAVRPRSIDETRRRLTRLGYQPALVDAVIQRLIEMGYLDDANFAAAWVESRDRARPRGENALRRELFLKGIDRETITAALQERAGRGSLSDLLGPAEAAEAATSVDRVAAERLLDRRRSGLNRETDPRKRRQKAYGLLARNGFDPDVCRDVAALPDSG